MRDEILNQKPAASKAPKGVSRSTQSQTADEAAKEPGSTQMDENIAYTELTATSEELGTTNTDQHAAAPRSPLRERQPGRANIAGKRQFGEEPLPPFIMPTLVRRKDPGARRPSRSGSSEPELPPTPVQLGSSSVHHRPRGLASSCSPKGSKSKSGEHRRRMRSGGSVISSPLKQKAQMPAEPESQSTESAQDHVEEAPESEPERPTEGNDEESSAELQDKHNNLHSLREKLQQLKRETEQLQTVIEKDGDLNEEDLSLLRQIIIEDGTSRGKFNKPSDLGENTLSYLTLFTPGNLQLTSQIRTKIVKGRTKMIYFLRIAAPPPWLPNALSCVFEVAVDAEDVRVEDIRTNEAMSVGHRTKSTRAEIYKWVNDRLDHPLHRLDVGGIIWGMGRWFGAAIERARIFQRLDRKYNKLEEETEEQNGELTATQGVELKRYLEMTQLQIIDKDLTVTAGGKRFKKKIMLIWNIDLDWTGGLTSNIHVAISGIPSRAEPGLKTVFCELVTSKGVVGAFERVWELIHGEGEELTAAGMQKGKRKRT